MWFIGVEVEQETSAPHPKKNPGSTPVHGGQPVDVLQSNWTCRSGCKYCGSILFLIGLNYIFLCFKLIIIHYHAPKQRIKLNHNINTIALFP